MQNNDAAGYLLDYCARKLDASKSVVVESHIAACGSCRELVEAQRAVWESLDSWEEIDVAPDFNRRLYARIEADGRRGIADQLWSAAVARWSPVSWWRAMPIALACATLTAALLIPAPGGRTPDVDQPQAKVEQVETEQVERTLQDLDMLNQLSPKLPAEASASGSM